MVKLNSTTIKVSVVIPVYNVELYLRQCLDSLKNQTLKEIEFILINDCSTDSCGTICDEYARNDDRFVVVHNKTNIRQGLSRNKGIEISRGEYIGFVDADDYIDSNFYEKLYSSAKTNHSDIAKAESIDVSFDGNNKPQSKLNTRISQGLKKGTPSFLLFTYEHCTAIYKRELLINNKIDYPDILNGEDNVFLLYANYYAKSISLISDTFYYYRQHSLSTIAIKEEPYFNSLLQSFNLYVDFINTHNIDKKYYDLYFILSFERIAYNYKELSRLPGRNKYKREFVKKILIIMSMYKYDSEFLFDSFINGFKNGDIHQQLKYSYAYKLSRAITWLPSKIKKIIK